MNNVAVSIFLPGLFALLLFFVFSYLYEQSRQAYFRAWQLGWLAYSLFYVLQAWTYFSSEGGVTYILSKLMIAAVALAIYQSTRLVQEDYRYHWTDGLLVAGAAGMAIYNYVMHLAGGHFRLQAPRPHVEMEAAIGVLLLYTAWRFWRIARQRDSLGFRLLAGSLVVWAPLMMFRQHGSIEKAAGILGNLLGPLPLMLVGIAMVIVLFEQERRFVQDNALAFSTLGVDASVVSSRNEVAPGLEKLLERLLRLLREKQAAICIAERWRAVLPSVAQGFSADFVAQMESDGSGEYLCDMAYRRGGMITFRGFAEMSEPMPAGPPGRFERCKELMSHFQVHTFTAISLQTRDSNFGVILFPHAGRKVFGTSQVRLLLGLAMQIGMTLENFVIMHDLQRRNREYELLTQMGQVISSRLDPDEVLSTIHKELGRLFDTQTFYIAFQEGDEVRYEYECVHGERRPPRVRKAGHGLTEYVIRTKSPLLIHGDVMGAMARLGVEPVGRPAQSLLAVPMLAGEKPSA